MTLDGTGKRRSLKHTTQPTLNPASSYRDRPPTRSPPRGAATGRDIGREIGRDTGREIGRERDRDAHGASYGASGRRDPAPAPPSARANFAPPPAAAFGTPRGGGRWDGDRNRSAPSGAKVFARERPAGGRARSPSPERVRQRCNVPGLRASRVSNAS
jgi:hypothetical protein